MFDLAIDRLSDTLTDAIRNRYPELSHLWARLDDMTDARESLDAVERDRDALQEEVDDLRYELARADEQCADYRRRLGL